MSRTRIRNTVGTLDLSLRFLEFTPLIRKIVNKLDSLFAFLFAAASGTDVVGDPADGDSRDLFVVYRGYCARKGVCQFLVFHETYQTFHMSGSDFGFLDC